MRPYVLLLIMALLVRCAQPQPRTVFTGVDITPVYTDSMSIRAIDFLDTGTLAFAGADGLFGTVGVLSGKVLASVMVHDSVAPSFRAVAHTDTDFFMLSVSDPALLYKTGEGGNMELVYQERGEGVFYDAMQFWDNKDGIALGDRVGDCISVLLTRDGGQTWQKVPCRDLPKAADGEGAFAASNTNIALQGDKVWMGTTAGNIYFSADKGATWEVIKTPMANDGATQGIYSLDFYDERTGFAIGGDYTAPEGNTNNKMRTDDGGATWKLVANGAAPGYKSCVQFVPGSYGQQLVAVGFTGISYSADGGLSWQKLSDEGFYTIRFLSATVAYAAGKNRVAKLSFATAEQ
ncbi:WD40/YVTN/BNR-like repeat-containing protein [Maribacter sp. 2307ULW6-5]|uniref:WD40/YVTN/BNR-like repeat-containing protein n=1 Tax=Maribacter sp. 2307ULW6-5 TaxID=3386275 RepID=UPI0039BD071C